jgi:hypothetical protein
MICPVKDMQDRFGVQMGLYEDVPHFFGHFTYQTFFGTRPDVHYFFQSDH